jgi:hypothetical protein
MALAQDAGPAAPTVLVSARCWKCKVATRNDQWRLFHASLAAWQTDGRRSSKRSHEVTDNGVGRVSAEPPPTAVCRNSIELES